MGNAWNKEIHWLWRQAEFSYINSKSQNKNTGKDGYGDTPLIPAFKWQRQADLCEIQSQPGLHSEFQDSQGYSPLAHSMDSHWPLTPEAIYSYGTLVLKLSIFFSFVIGSSNHTSNNSSGGRRERRTSHLSGRQDGRAELACTVHCFFPFLLQQWPSSSSQASNSSHTKSVHLWGPLAFVPLI